MARILPILSPHSQFPYPYDKPLFLASCRIRSGKMNAWKRRYICISRNCLYYYLNEEGLLDQAAEEDSEYLLPTGVVPLWRCDCVVCAEEAKKTKLMEAVKAKKGALAALRQEKNEKARAMDARVRELQRSLFQLRGKVGEGESLDEKMLEIEEANGQTRRVIATVAEFQQRAQAAQQELAQQQTALEALKAKQEALEKALKEKEVTVATLEKKATEEATASASVESALQKEVVALKEEKERLDGALKEKTEAEEKEKKSTSEERPERKEISEPCRYLWSPYH